MILNTSLIFSISLSAGGLGDNGAAVVNLAAGTIPTELRCVCARARALIIAHFPGTIDTMLSCWLEFILLNVLRAIIYART